MFITCVLIILEKAAMRPAVLTGNRQRACFRHVTHSLSGVSYHLAAVMRVKDVNLRTVKPQL